MTNQLKTLSRSLVCLVFATAFSLPVMADAISPSINDSGKVYSKEKPNESLFGTGSAGRLAEASQLRFKADRLILDGEIEEAITVLAKAVQFDPEDPGGHIMLARAMTQKLRANRANMDWELYGQCLDEWNLIAKHDADHIEQLEARNAIASLKKMAKEQVLKAKGKTPKRSRLAGLNPLNRFK